MEHDKISETFETSFLANLWTERWSIISFTIVTCFSFHAGLDSIKFFEAMLITFFFTGIFFLGFVAIAAHVQYYFGYEKSRKVELTPDRLIISRNGQDETQIFKSEIIQITVYDKRHVDEANMFPTFLDPFYYLTVTGTNRQEIILTCLLDIELKKKISVWYGQELKHIYQFFPFPGSPYR